MTTERSRAIAIQLWQARLGYTFPAMVFSRQLIELITLGHAHPAKDPSCWSRMTNIVISSTKSNPEVPWFTSIAGL